jgi:hypothetical protein
MTAGRTPHAPRFDVTITRERIETAIRRDSAYCMIAEALKEAYPNARYVLVDLQCIRFSDMTKRLRFVYLTPRVAQHALIDFDQGQVPEPFAFRMPANAQVTVMPNDRSPRRAQPGKPGRSLAPGTGMAVRAWARTQPEWQDKIRDRGGIPTQIRRAYEEAHQGVTPTTGPARPLVRRADLVHDIVGGRTPEVAAVAGGHVPGSTPLNRRRAFGLRALER